mmetsp:Transcript_7122/g.5093  ORF Transcript_7122/g.5093 Transcript_7122/m.5093 type:complete len:98 (+) Transcript_7122:189-482(+)
MNAIFIILMLCSNALMMRFYILSMHQNGAAKATVYNFAVNYLASILFGDLFFGEHISTRLITGIVLILIGTFIISMCQEEDDPYGPLADKKKIGKED